MTQVKAIHKFKGLTFKGLLQILSASFSRLMSKLTSIVKTRKRSVYAINLTSSVTKSNHTGWSGHKFLTGQVIVDSHLPGLQFPQQRSTLTSSELCPVFACFGNVRVLFFSFCSEAQPPASTRTQDHQSTRAQNPSLLSYPTDHLQGLEMFLIKYQCKYNVCVSPFCLFSNPTDFSTVLSPTSLIYHQGLSSAFLPSSPLILTYKISYKTAVEVQNESPPRYASVAYRLL